MLEHLFTSNHLCASYLHHECTIWSCIRLQHQLPVPIIGICEYFSYSESIKHIGMDPRVWERHRVTLPCFSTNNMKPCVLVDQGPAGLDLTGKTGFRQRWTGRQRRLDATAAAWEEQMSMSFHSPWPEEITWQRQFAVQSVGTIHCNIPAPWNGRVFKRKGFGGIQGAGFSITLYFLYMKAHCRYYGLKSHVEAQQTKARPNCKERPHLIFLSQGLLQSPLSRIKVLILGRTQCQGQIHWFLRLLWIEQFQMVKLCKSSHC